MTARGKLFYAGTVAASSIILAAIFLADHQIRFFQGDSISYLSTDGSYMPPDRSWAFGLLVNWLLNVTHTHAAFIALQVLLTLVVLAFCSALLAPERRGRSMAYAIFALLICLDPMLNLYARFYMTDLLACLLFVAFLACLCRALRTSWRGFLGWAPLLAVLMAAAIFTRVAYAVIAEGTILAALVSLLLRRRCVPGRLAVALMFAPLGVALLLIANSVVFAQKFPGEHFLTKSSGVFLMGTFAPALTADDFRAAGVAVSDAEIDALDLPNYDKRGAQIWSADERSAQGLVKRHLGVTSNNTSLVDGVSSRIVWNAVRRDPSAVARVYLTALWMHFQPDQWRRFLDHEVGLTRPLPPEFVGWINQMSRDHITIETSTLSSPVLEAFRWFAPAYAVLLPVWALIACWRLVAGRADVGTVLVGAGFIAALAAAPAYSVYVIPRYLIATVFMGHLLFAEAVVELLLGVASARPRGRRSAVSLQAQ